MAGKRSRRVVVVVVVCRDGSVCGRRVRAAVMGEEGLKASLLLVLVEVAAIIRTSMAAVAVDENFISFSITRTYWTKSNYQSRSILLRNRQQCVVDTFYSTTTGEERFEAGSE